MATRDISELRIEPYLSNFSTEYRIDKNVGEFVSPSFKVNKDSGKYQTFGKSNFRIYDNKITKGVLPKSITKEGDDASYECLSYSLAGEVYDDDLRNTMGEGTLKLKEDTIAFIKDRQIAAREKRILDIAGSTSIVTQYTDLSGAWATAASGTPVTNIKTALGVIDASTGKQANRIILPFDVALKMTECDEWRDNFKYTQSNIQGVLQVMDALRNLGLEPRITGAVGLNTTEGGASDPTWEKIFDQKVLIFYAEPNPTARSQTFMSSPYTIKDRVESYRPEGLRATRYTILEIIDELLVNANCAYLYTDVI